MRNPKMWTFLEKNAKEITGMGIGGWKNTREEAQQDASTYAKRTGRTVVIISTECWFTPPVTPSDLWEDVIA